MNYNKNIFLLIFLFFDACADIAITTEDTRVEGAFGSASSNIKKLYLVDIEFDKDVKLNEEIVKTKTNYTMNVGIATRELEIKKIKASYPNVRIRLNNLNFKNPKKLYLKLGENKIKISLYYLDAFKYYYLTIIRSKGNVQYVKASNTGNNNYFGIRVATDRNILAVGASYRDNGKGGVYIYEKINGNLIETAYLTASNAGNNDHFGGGIAIHDGVIVVGARDEDTGEVNSGAAYVFEKINGTWTETAFLKAHNPSSGDLFTNNNAITIYNNIIAIGANYEDTGGGDSGAVYIFEKQNDGSWIETAFLKRNPIHAWTGFSFVSLYEHTLAVGATGADVNGYQSGEAYIFERQNDGTWLQKQILTPSNAHSRDYFGRVKLYKNILVIGAHGETSSATGINGDQTNDHIANDNKGAAYIFERQANGLWVQTTYLKASNTGAGDYFATQIDVKDDVIVISSYGEASSARYYDEDLDQDDNTANYSGAVYVFQKTDQGNNWEQVKYLKAPNTDANDRFGNSIAIWGDKIVVGALLEDSDLTGTNIDIITEDNNNFTNSGAVYIFD